MPVGRSIGTGGRLSGAFSWDGEDLPDCGDHGLQQRLGEVAISLDELGAGHGVQLGGFGPRVVAEGGLVGWQGDGQGWGDLLGSAGDEYTNDGGGSGEQVVLKLNQPGVVGVEPPDVTPHAADSRLWGREQQLLPA